MEAITVDGRPSAVAVAGGLVWVADDENDLVHTFDATSHRPTADPLAVDANPVAMDASDDAVWVAHAGGTLTRIGLEDREAASFEVGSSLTDVVVVGTSVWACDLVDSSLVEVDAELGEVLGRYPIQGGVVRATRTPRWLWISGLEDTVTAIDPDSGDIGPTVEVGSAPIGLAAAGEQVWVANSEEATVSRIDAATGESTGRDVSVGDGPIAVAVFGDRVVVANQDDRSLTLIDPATGLAGEPIPVDLHIRDLASADALWVAGTDPNALVAVT